MYVYIYTPVDEPTCQHSSAVWRIYSLFSYSLVNYLK